MSAPTVVAYRVTQFGLPLVDGLCCSKCGEARWSATVETTRTTGHPEALCGNCNRALKHGACELDEDDRCFVDAQDAICWPCTDALRDLDAEQEEIRRGALVDYALDTRRGK